MRYKFHFTNKITNYKFDTILSIDSFGGLKDYIVNVFKGNKLNIIDWELNEEGGHFDAESDDKGLQYHLEITRA